MDDGLADGSYEQVKLLKMTQRQIPYTWGDSQMKKEEEPTQLREGQETSHCSCKA